MRSASKGRDGLSVDYSGLLASHDIMYLSPPVHGWEGLPVGNGETGAMIWNPADELRAQINDVRLWDDGPASAAELEGFPGGVLRHAGQLAIRPGLPLFGWEYLEDYEARLELASAEVQIEAKGPLGQVHVRALFSHPHQVLLVEYEDHLAEPTARLVVLERFGTRVLGDWYRRILREAAVGLTQTHASTDGRDLLLTQSLGSSRFAVAVRILGAHQTIKPMNSWAVEAEVAGDCECRFRLLLALACDQDDGETDPQAELRETLNEAERAGPDAIRKAHREDWTEQWRRSFVHLPDDRYLENLWYLANYHYISSRRGKEPPFFIGGLWSWTRDLRPWGHLPYHWNMHSPNLPLHSMNRAELMQSYLDWKCRQWPHAKAFAREVFDCGGAMFTEYASLRGEQLAREPMIIRNLSPTLQIAMEFYRHWRFTCDEAFLREKALPLMRDVARFWFDYLERDEEGTYHVPRSRPYEAGYEIDFRDCLTDLAHLRWFLPALIEAERGADEVTSCSAQAREVLANLAPIAPIAVHPHNTCDNGEEGRVYDNPFFDGEPFRDGDRTYAIGHSMKHGRLIGHTETYLDPDFVFGAFPSSQSSPVYPCGLAGPDAHPVRRESRQASQRDIEMWEWGRNSLRTMRRATPDHPYLRHVAVEPKLAWTGHSLELLAFARLGLAGNLARAMSYFVQEYQTYPQGLWCYWGWRTWRERITHPVGVRFGAGPVEEAEWGTAVVGPDKAPKVDFPDIARVLHCSLEPEGIFAETVNEMLMTSYDGTIRLFPAYEQDGAFELAAAGGFLVAARQVRGDVEFVRVHSRAGQTCRLASPWPARKVRIHVDEGDAPAIRSQDGVLAFDTRPGLTYWLQASRGHPKPFVISGTRAAESRRLGRTQLGKPRDF